MNMNRQKKIVEVKNTKIKPETIKVKFKNNTSISWKIYQKDIEYEIDKKLLNNIKNFIY